MLVTRLQSGFAENPLSFTRLRPAVLAQCLWSIRLLLPPRIRIEAAGPTGAPKWNGPFQ
jgi:hypothetical protein